MGDSKQTTAIAEYSETEAALAELRDKHGATVWVVDTPDRMAGAKVARKDIRKCRTNLEKIRKLAKRDALDHCQRVDGEAKRLNAAFVELEEPVDYAIKEVEQAEKREADRKEQEKQEHLVKVHAEIDRIKNIPVDLVSADTDAIQKAAEALKALDLSWMGEAEMDAGLHRDTAIHRLREMYTTAKEQAAEQSRIEKERAEFEQVQAEKAERDEAERKRLEAEERKRRARIEAEEKASRERMAEEERTAREARAKADAEAAAERTERERLRAEQAEKDRAEREKRDAEDRERREKIEADSSAHREARRKIEEEVEQRERAKRDAEEDRLREQRDKLEAEQRAKAESDRREREARESQEREKYDAEQKLLRKKEDADREKQRKINERLDAREMLGSFVEQYGHLDEFDGVVAAIAAVIEASNV